MQKPADYPTEGVLKALVLKAIIWDNCEGRFVTMANPGEIIDVTKYEDGSYSAHFDMGDWTCSDGVDNEQIKIVSEEEAKQLEEAYRKQMNERIQRNRKYMFGGFEGGLREDDFDDDQLDSLYEEDFDELDEEFDEENEKNDRFYSDERFMARKRAFINLRLETNLDMVEGGFHNPHDFVNEIERHLNDVLKHYIPELKVLDVEVKDFKWNKEKQEYIIPKFTDKQDERNKPIKGDAFYSSKHGKGQVWHNTAPHNPGISRIEILFGNEKESAYVTFNASSLEWDHKNSRWILNYDKEKMGE